MSFWKMFPTALYGFGSYPELARVKGWKAFLYILLTVVFGVAVMLAWAVPSYVHAGGFAGMAEDKLPQFTISDGRLTMDSLDYWDKEKQMHIYVDTANTKPDLTKAENAMSALVAGSEEMSIVSNAMGYTQTYSFADLNEGMGKIDKARVVKFLGTAEFQVFFIMMYGFALLFVFAVQALYDVLWLTLLGNLINMFFVRLPVRFGTMVKLGVFARTLPFLMSILMTLVAGFPIEQIVYYAIGAFYVYKGLKNIKNQEGVVIADLDNLTQ